MSISWPKVWTPHLAVTLRHHPEAPEPCLNGVIHRCIQLAMKLAQGAGPEGPLKNMGNLTKSLEKWGWFHMVSPFISGEIGMIAFVALGCFRYHDMSWSWKFYHALPSASRTRGALPFFGLLDPSWCEFRVARSGPKVRKGPPLRVC